MAPKQVLVLNRAHNFIIDVQPSFPTITVFVPVVHVDRILPATCGLAVVVKYPIELVPYRIRRFLGNKCHGFWTERATGHS
jgi:hypothetical protein